MKTFGSCLALVFLASLLVACATTQEEATPIPTLSLRQVLEKTSTRMAALQSVAFSLEHETGTTLLQAGVNMRAVEGQVALPDGFRLKVDAVATLLRASIEINVIVVGNDAFITDPFTGTWRKVPPDTLPFNFRDLGRTLSGVLGSIQASSFAGEDGIGDSGVRRIKGTVSSDSLLSLVPGAAQGLTVGLELWIEEGQGLLRKVRIEGKVVPKDEPETVRLLTLHSFDEPVEVSPPDTVP